MPDESRKISGTPAQADGFAVGFWTLASRGCAAPIGEQSGPPISHHHWSMYWLIGCVLIGLVAISSQTTCLFAAEPAVKAPTEHPLSAEIRQKIRSSQERIIADTTANLTKNPQALDSYSQRGDARFFLGEFAGAVEDYDRMVELDPELDASHWRRGIAWFYAGKYKEAAGQFERYHSFDDVDRENGIWRFFSQYKALGPEKAAAGLLKYKKDDREPFPSVYRLFSNELTGPEILDAIRAAKLDDEERNKRLFYADLYVGLHADLLGKPELARPHLHAATANPWPERAGYGPRYMWHVGRLHYERLSAPKDPAPQKLP